MYYLKSVFTLLAFILISKSSDSQSVLVVTNGDDSGAGSLRQVISEALSGDTIRFYDDIDTVGLTSGELLIDKSLVVEGNPGKTCIVKSDTTLDFRIFKISAPDSIRVELNNLCIRSGKAPDGYNTEIHGQLGGGICIPDSIHEIILKDCALEMNVSGSGHWKTGVSKSGNGGNGGGIYSLSKLTLENCVLAQNQCGPGAEGWSGGDWDSQDGGNGGSGGGIFCLNDLILSECTLTNNHSGDGGSAQGGAHSGGGNGGSGGIAGAIYCKNSEVLIINTSFENNNSGKGGYAGNWSTYCTAGYAGGGGALALDNCSSNLTNVIFFNNLTGRGGGASGNPSGSPTDGGNGGAIFVLGGQFSCQSCTFNFNSTGKGGSSEYNWGGVDSYGDSGDGAGIYLDTAKFIIHHSSFTGNYTAKGEYVGDYFSGGSGGNGGGIFITRLDSTSIITNCLFEENHTGDGITVADTDELQVISGANGGNGGGIYLRKSTSVLFITGCIFKSNYCGNSVIPSGLTVPSHFFSIPNGGSGGAVCNAGGNVRIINSTIAGNCCGTATVYNNDSVNMIPLDSLRGKGGGLYGVNEVINSIIADNSSGNQFSNDLEGPGIVNYSLISNDTLAEFSGAYNFINVAPGFVDFPDDLSLRPYSLAIDHGSPDTTGLFLPETDMAGNPRIYSGRIDMGAYEFQGEPAEQFTVSTDLIVMDSTVAGSFAVDSLTIFNYGKPLIIFAETTSLFSLSLDKTGWNSSLPGITIPEGLPVSSLVIYVKFESLSAGDFQSVININTENSSYFVAVWGYCKSTEGIYEQNNELNVSAFPNPFMNETRISYYLEEAGDLNLSVYHSSGVKVDEVKLKNQPAGINTYFWKINSLPDGIYYLLIRKGRAASLIKLVIIS